MKKYLVMLFLLLVIAVGFNLITKKEPDMKYQNYGVVQLENGSYIQYERGN